MTRKAKRDQRDIQTFTFICFQCKQGECVKCIDAMRLRVGFEGSICCCGRQLHNTILGDIMMTETAEQARSEQPVPSYRYRDRQLNIVWQTSVPKDDEAAIAYFHVVVRFSPNMKPVYCERIDRDDAGEHFVMLKEIFDPEKMATRPFSMSEL